MKIFIALTIALLFGLVLSGCKPIVNKLAFHPDNTNVISSDKLPEGVEEFVVVTEDNIKITNLYLPMAGSDKLLIYFHGNAGNIYHRIPDLMRLRKFGINIVGVSYRGYGKSEGSTSEEGVYLDGKETLKYANDKLGFSDKNILIMGRSIGTAVAINTAQHKKLAGLILVTPLTSGKAHAETGGLSPVSSLAGNSFDNLSKIKNIETPVLIIHGTRDRVIPYSMGRKIFDETLSPKKFISIKGAAHNNLQDVYGQEYWKSIFSFLKTSLRTSHSPH